MQICSSFSWAPAVFHSAMHSAGIAAAPVTIEIFAVLAGFFAYFAYFKMAVSRVVSFCSEPLAFT